MIMIGCLEVLNRYNVVSHFQSELSLQFLMQLPRAFGIKILEMESSVGVIRFHLGIGGGGGGIIIRLIKEIC